MRRNFLEVIKVRKSKVLDSLHPHLFVREEPRNTYVGSLEMSLREAEGYILDSGFKRNLLSYMTYNKYKTEEGSVRKYRSGDYVCYLEGFLGTPQVHVSVFSGLKDGFVDVYAHWETNKWRHPVQHLQGKRYDADRGVDFVKDRFDYLDFVKRSRETRYKG